MTLLDVSPLKSDIVCRGSAVFNSTLALVGHTTTVVTRQRFPIPRVRQGAKNFFSGGIGFSRLESSIPCATTLVYAILTMASQNLIGVPGIIRDIRTVCQVLVAENVVESGYKRSRLASVVQNKWSVLSSQFVNIFAGPWGRDLQLNTAVL